MIVSSEGTWQAAAERKRAEVAKLLGPYTIPGDAIPPPAELPDATNFPRAYLEPREIEFTEKLSIEELLGKLARREITAKEVTLAFCKRAAIAHQVTNCLSDVLFQQALAQADELDAYIAAHGKPIGRLHGLPVSWKDQIRVEGAETTVGYISNLGRKETAKDEALLVKELRELGAVIYAKTNVPTALMAIDTNNNIIGYTWNARNRLVSAGGSSGGEASLLAMKGSIIGFGTDIAASIRLPAAFQGLYGLKPSIGRLPWSKIAGSMEGQELVSPVVGPMGHRVDDLEVITKSILSTQPWLHDPTVVNMPWRQSETEAVAKHAKSGGLAFGVLRSDGIVLPHPPITRAIDETVAKLKAHGHEVIEWEPPSHKEAFEIIWSLFVMDGGNDIHSSIGSSGEPVVPQIANIYGSSPGHLTPKTVNESWSYALRRNAYQTAYLEYWNSTASKTSTGRAVDFFILPIAPTASYLPGQAIYPGYTGVINALDYTAISVPVTTVDKARDLAAADAGRQRGEYLGEMDEQVWKQYDPNLFHGTPVGLQLVGRRLEEERVLAAAAELGRCLSE
ncbi:amidase [Xylona heveae TC161]|uniref:amidase n=1 Tax=Xylona heveae (strain CBS 132557 / TC161) TaxID=1328760 RepID=A0A165A2F0_XYLHT|nr:amidase [Xylona heveae TC161]KZF19859.1 amidase [Xylona heveae TC161]